MEQFLERGQNQGQRRAQFVGYFGEEAFAFQAQLLFLVAFHFGGEHFMLQLHFVFQPFGPHADAPPDIPQDQGCGEEDAQAEPGTVAPMRVDGDVQAGNLVRGLVGVDVLDFENVVAVLQVGVGHLFLSLRVDPFLLVGVQAVGIHLLFVRVGKVAEVEGKVAVLVAQPDVRQVGDAIGQDGLSVDRPADVYGAVVDLESGYQDLLRYFEPVCLVGLEVSQVLVVPPEQGVLPVEGRTVAARHVVVVEQVLAAVVTRDARVGSDPDVSLFVFGDAAHEVVAQPVLGAVGLHDAVFRGREDGQPVHIAHIQQSVAGSVEGADGRVGNAGCFFISCFQPFFLTVVSVEPRSGA